MPLPDLGGEEKPIAEDKVRHVAEAGVVPAQPPGRLEQQVEVEGDEADPRNLAGVETVLVEEIGDVGRDLDDWQGAVREVRDVHENGEVVHGLGDSDLELLSERGLRGPVEDLGRQLDEGLPVASLAVAPRTADKVVTAGPTMALEEGVEGGLHSVAGEIRDQLGDGQRGGPLARFDRPGRQPSAVRCRCYAAEAPVRPIGAHLERVSEGRSGAAAGDVDVDDTPEAEGRGRGARAERELAAGRRARSCALIAVAVALLGGGEGNFGPDGSADAFDEGGRVGRSEPGPGEAVGRRPPQPLLMPVVRADQPVEGENQGAAARPKGSGLLIRRAERAVGERDLVVDNRGDAGVGVERVPQGPVVGELFPVAEDAGEVAPGGVLDHPQDAARPAREDDAPHELADHHRLPEVGEPFGVTLSRPGAGALLAGSLPPPLGLD